jgi:alpha-amylase
MRLATHGHLIAAEDLADAALGRLRGADVLDLDLDGRDEVRLADEGQVVTITPDEGAGIGAWDIRAARHALTAVMRRRPEAYHETLREAEASRAAIAQPAGVTSIHELARPKEENLGARLAYDWHERRSGLVRFLPPGGLPPDGSDPAVDPHLELGDFVDGPFALLELGDGRVLLGRDGIVRGAAGNQAVRVEKSVTLGGERRAATLDVAITITNRSAQPLDATVALEWAITMLGGGGNPAAWWDVGGVRTAHDVAGRDPGTSVAAQGNDFLGLAVRSSFDPPAELRWSPIETISNSESGFERAYQGSVLLVGWPLAIGPGDQRVVRVRQAVTSDRDRTSDEAEAGAEAGAEGGAG